MLISLITSPDLKDGKPVISRALEAFTMSSHVSVACSTDLSVAGGARRNALAPYTASTTCPDAPIWPRVQAATILA